MFPDLIPTDTSAGSALPARRTTTPTLFSPTGHAERRFWEFFTAHIRNPQHPPRLPRGRAALRRVVRTPRPRPRPGRAHGGSGLHRAALRSALASEREATPRRAADALRLARRRPGPAVQSRELSARPEARRQDRQDPGALREGDQSAPRRHRRFDPRRSSRPRAPRRARLQLRARERRGLASRRRLLHPGPALVFPPPREGRALQTSSPPTTQRRPTSTPTSPPPASAKTAAVRCSGAASSGGAMRSRIGRCRA